MRIVPARERGEGNGNLKTGGKTPVVGVFACCASRSKRKHEKRRKHVFAERKVILAAKEKRERGGETRGSRRINREGFEYSRRGKANHKMNILQTLRRTVCENAACRAQQMGHGNVDERTMKQT